MEKNKLVNLLGELNKINPIGSQQTKTQLEVGSEKFKKWILIAALILFVILLFLVVFHEFVIPLSVTLRYIALVVSCLVMLLPNIAMLIDVGVSFFQLIRFKTESFRLLVLEVQHDESNVENIMVFDREALEEIKDWLEVKCLRIKNKISLFFGNPEKIALFSLFGFGWVVFKEVFNKNIPQNIPSIINDPIYFILLVSVAFFTGISIGAMFLNQQLRRYSYCIEIIEMALKKKSKIL